MKVLAIVGSSRVKGNTSQATDAALAEIEQAGIEVEKIVLTNNLKLTPCQCHDGCATYAECRQKGDDTEVILEKMEAADGVIFGTPVYYYNVSAQLKLIMDRTFFMYNKKRRLKAKSVGMVVVAESEGVQDAVEALNRYLKLTISTPPERVHVASGYAKQVGDAPKTPELIESCRLLGRNMAKDLLG